MLLYQWPHSRRAEQSNTSRTRIGQIEGIEKGAYEKAEDYKERVQRILKETEQAKREGRAVAIEAKILKHRNGVPGSVIFEFYSRYNFFKEKDGQVL